MGTSTVTEFKGEAAVSMRCWCSIAFALPKTLHDYYERANEANPGSYSIHCPLGHGMVPSSRTPASDRLRTELAQAKAKLDQESARVASLRQDVTREREHSTKLGRRINGYKGVVARTKRRAMDGRCPCCSEQFKNLKAHMRSQHPGFDPERGAEALAEKQS